MDSMTGFGMGTAGLGDAQIAIEVRALNHRFVEVRVRVPPELSQHAFFLEQECRTRLGRGRYDVTVRIDGPSPACVQLDTRRLESLHADLNELQGRLAPGAPVSVASLLSLPEILVSREAEVEPTRAALTQALTEALQTLKQMRQREGEALRRELGERLRRAQALRSDIAQLAPQLAKAHFDRLNHRLARLMTGDHPVDSARLATELALLSDRVDVTEELVRLDSHFEQFTELLNQGEPVGRKLEFLLQEIGRETNTIGAKCGDVRLTRSVVALKSEVERLREQVQNVE